MNVKILLAYMRKCSEYNWEPKWEGLGAFYEQAKIGFRNPVNFDMY